EKTIVAYEAELQHAIEESQRLSQKREQLARERRQADEERTALDSRQEEARSSITRLENDQRLADERLTIAQRRLFEAREGSEDRSQQAANARARHAALVERASALASEAERLEEAWNELQERATNLGIELEGARGQVDQLGRSIEAGTTELDADVDTHEKLGR